MISALNRSRCYSYAEITEIRRDRREDFKSPDFAVVAAYVRELKSVAMEALSEETVLISFEQVYHAV